MTDFFRSPVRRVPQTKDPQIDIYGPYDGDYQEIGGRESVMPARHVESALTISHVPGSRE
jgi:hypothetical protein